MPESLRRSNRHARGTKRKRTIIIGLGAAMAVTGGVLAVPAAMAALESSSDGSPAFQLKDAESFDTDALMAKLCPGPTSTTPSRDFSFWFMDDETGELVEDTLDGVGRPEFRDSDPKTHRFHGYCEYPVSDTEDFNGEPVQVGEDVPNCGDKVQTTEGHTLRIDNSSEITHSVSVGASFDFSIIKDVLGIGGSVEVTNSWSFGQVVSRSRTRDIQVPPQTVGFLERVPKMRTVTTQPNFFIERWQVIDSGNYEDQTFGWKGQGFEKSRITSSGYEISATADVLDDEGFPAGPIRADDRPATAADCD